MLNNVSIMGNLTADPELRHTGNGVPVTSFTIACERTYKKGEERQTDFITIVCWRQVAEFVCNNFKKSNRIAVTGSLRSRNFTTKDGIDKTIVEVEATEVCFCAPKANV